MRICNYILSLNTGDDISLTDVTSDIRGWIKAEALSNGMLVVISRHTTTAVMINEYESRLLDDIKTFFNQLVPSNQHYLHNDLHLRDCPPDEPENAHSHIMSLLMGSSETIPIVNGVLQLGQYQSIILVDLDGPRTRQVTLQFIGE